MDLRGKILRIHPEAEGGYTVPEGNLFPKGTVNLDAAAPGTDAGNGLAAKGSGPLRVRFSAY